jgi:hypothetical protein
MTNRRRQQRDFIFRCKLIGVFEFFFLQHLHEVLMFVGEMLGVNAAQPVLAIQLEPWNELFIKKPRSTRESGLLSVR